MFCLEKKTMTYISIIETLDKLVEPITATNLAKEIDYGTPPTVLGMVKEIKKIIEEIYDETDVRLIINHKGILLQRKSGNLTKLYNQFLASDLGYEIVKNLILEKRMNTHHFCVAFGVSESTLKRKIKLLNRLVKSYDFHISCSNKVKIKGNELNFRIFSFIFLASVHPQLNEIDWIKGKASYLQRAKEIANYLSEVYFYQPLSESQNQLLALWLYITNLSDGREKNVQFSKKQQQIIQSIKFIEKPAFLSKWSTNNWQFLLVGVYSFQLSDFPVKENIFATMEISDKLLKFGKTFIEIFEANFSTLNQLQRKKLLNQLRRIYIADNFLRVDQKIFPTLNYNSIFQLESRYPSYNIRFENFFSQLSSHYPQLRSGDFKVKFLRICYELYPLEKTIQEIRVAYFSGQYSNFDTVAKENMQIYFANKYQLCFTEDLEATDLIISTIDHELLMEDHAKKTVFIRSPFLEKDLQNISNALEVWEMKQLEEMGDCKESVI